MFVRLWLPLVVLTLVCAELCPDPCAPLIIAHKKPLEDKHGSLILVTGGAGFVGSNLIVKLLSVGHNVFSLDNYTTGTKANEHDGCTYVRDSVHQIARVFNDD